MSRKKRLTRKQKNARGTSKPSGKSKYGKKIAARRRLAASLGVTDRSYPALEWVKDRQLNHK